MESSDDLSLVLARGESVVSLVEYVSAAQSAGTAWPEVLGVLTERFALSFDDARLAVDRVPGGVVRAASGNAANEPDRERDPVAWVSYQRARGLPVPAPEPMATPEQSAAAVAVVEAAHAGAARRGTDDVVVALEVVRSCVAFVGEPAVQRRLLIQAATSVSTAAEARIAALGSAPYMIEGSRDWADGVQLGAAARMLAERFAGLGESSFEDGAYELAGRITTQLLGQSAALVGRVMLDSARCALRLGEPARAAQLCETVVAEFAPLLERFETDAPVDEDRIALRHLLDAIDVLVSLQGATPQLAQLRATTADVLDRA